MRPISCCQSKFKVQWRGLACAARGVICRMWVLTARRTHNLGQSAAHTIGGVASLVCPGFYLAHPLEQPLRHRQVPTPHTPHHTRPEPSGALPSPMLPSAPRTTLRPDTKESRATGLREARPSVHWCVLARNQFALPLPPGSRESLSRAGGRCSQGSSIPGPSKRGRRLCRQAIGEYTKFGEAQRTSSCRHPGVAHSRGLGLSVCHRQVLGARGQP